MEVTLEGGANAAAPGGSAINEEVMALQDEDDVCRIMLPMDRGRRGAENAVFTQFVAHSEQMADRMVLVQLAHGMADVANTGLPWPSYISGILPRGPRGCPLTREVVTRPRVGLTGHIAGVVARTDNRVGAWQIAAGLSADVRGIAEFSRSVSRIQHAPITTRASTSCAWSTAKTFALWPASSVRTSSPGLCGKPTVSDRCRSPSGTR